MNSKFQYKIIKYLTDAEYPKERNTDDLRRKWRTLTDQYVMLGDQLWKRKGKDSEQLLKVISQDQLYSLLYMFHNDPTGGHLSAEKMREKIKK